MTRYAFVASIVALTLWFKTRKPRLQELIGVVKAVSNEKQVGLIDLNTPLADRPEMFTEADGVHPNKAGYLTIAELVAKALRDSLELCSGKPAQAGTGIAYGIVPLVVGEDHHQIGADYRVFLRGQSTNWTAPL